MQRWLVAKASDPGRPLVEVRFERPWTTLWLVPRVATTALAPEAEEWRAVVDVALTTGVVWDRLGSGRSYEPPHTRSARRVGLCMRTLSSRLPALVAYEAGASAPVARAAPPADGEGLHAATRRAVIDLIEDALSDARLRGWGGPQLDDHNTLMRVSQARTADELEERLRELAAAAAERTALREELDARLGVGDADDLDGALWERFARALGRPAR